MTMKRKKKMKDNEQHSDKAIAINQYQNKIIFSISEDEKCLSMFCFFFASTVHPIDNGFIAKIKRNKIKKVT